MDKELIKLTEDTIEGIEELREELSNTLKRHKEKAQIAYDRGDVKELQSVLEDTQSLLDYVVNNHMKLLNNLRDILQAFIRIEQNIDKLKENFDELKETIMSDKE